MKYLFNFNNENQASITTQTALLLLFLTSLALGTSFLFSTIRSNQYNYLIETHELRKITSITKEIITAIQNDPTPLSDSPHDPAFSISNLNGVGIFIKDISSSINILFCDDQLLNKIYESEISLPSELAAPTNKSILKNYRNSYPFTHPLTLKNLFNNINFNDKTIGFYSYPDIYSTDLQILKSIYLDLSQDTIAAQNFTTRLNEKRKSTMPLSAAELQHLLGIYADKFNKILGIGGQININFASKTLLEILMHHIGIDSQDSIRIINNIIQIRENKEIDDNQFQLICGNTQLYTLLTKWFGTKTYFWEITVSGNIIQRSIIARDLLNSNKIYSIIEMEEKNAR